jgi:beta-glucanase (GH16 family)
VIFLVSPGVFQRYVQEHPNAALQAKQEGVADWQWVQKRFEKLGLHCKQPDGPEHLDVRGQEGAKHSITIWQRTLRLVTET